MPNEKIDLSVNLAGMTMKNPVVVASGTFGFGREYGQFYDLGQLGGICAKGLTLNPRQGNPAPRIAETPMGILNSVGLQNPGVDAFIAQELPFLRNFDVKVIANISGNTPEEYGIMCEKLAGAGVDMIEVNISCPNVKAGGLAYGTRPELAAEVTQMAKSHAGKVPVMVKLSPNVTDITLIAKAVADAGADAVSLIIPNVRRIQAMSYRPEEPAESHSLVLEDSVQRHIQLINILKEKDVPKIQKELISHLDWSLADFLASSPLL